MNKSKWMVLGAAIVMWAGAAQAAQGQLGLNYSVGPNFIIGSKGASDAGSVQPGVGAGLQYGLLPNVDVLFSYDYVHADLRSQAITFGGQYRLSDLRSGGVTPFVGAGLGFGKPHSGEGWDHFSMKLNGGLIKSLTNDISMAGTLGYQYIDGTRTIKSVHAIQPSLRVIYLFN